MNLPGTVGRVLSGGGRDLYFDHARSGRMSPGTRRAMKRMLARESRSRGEDGLRWQSLVEETRVLSSRALRARPEEVALVQSTSAGLSIVAGAIPWKPGDRILLPRDEHPANVYPWLNLACRGVEVIRVDGEPHLMEQLAEAWTPQVRLVAVSAIRYDTGAMRPLPDIARLCHDRGALLCVDAAQSVGLVETDVGASGVDFLATTACKWLAGPRGIGLLYVRGELLKDLLLPSAGWASAGDLGNYSAQRFVPADGAERFETGTISPVLLAGMSAAIGGYLQAGPAQAQQHCRQFASRLTAGLKRSGFHVVSPDSPAGIVVFDPAPLDAPWLARRLSLRGIRLTQRGDLVRISVGRTNSAGQVDRLLGVLEGSLRKPGGNRYRGTLPALTGRTALVTGAGSGLGRSVARQLAGAGAHVIVSGRDETKVSLLANELRDAGYLASVRACDLADEADVAAFAGELAQRPDAIDIFVPCAAVAPADSEARAGRLAMQVNYHAVTRISQALLGGMERRGRGWILLPVSATGRAGVGLLADHFASKAALWTWGESLGRRLHGGGVVVSVVSPPQMPSDLLRGSLREVLRRYRIDGPPIGCPHAAARRALAGLFAGRRHIHASLSGWLRVAINALTPGLFDRLLRCRQY
jgi:selenocysteine lyase/cysteine desulfurase/short-subunit dehydrogenase